MMQSTSTKIGVIGAGQMGSGIALVCAQAGMDVPACRTSARTKTMQSGARDRQRHQLSRQARRKASSDRERRQRRCDPRPDLRRRRHARPPLGDCDLVIEAASENEEVKRKIFAMVCAAFVKAGRDASPPTRRRSRSPGSPRSTANRPERFIGMHFMNPAFAVMQLVELIRGIATSQDDYVRGGSKA